MNGTYTQRRTTQRQNYGLGDLVRKLIPNEIANVAAKAAPFVAPFNPIAAGLMRGIGRYDKRGNLGDALKQGLLTYGGGQVARHLGGAGMQTGFDPRGGMGGGMFTSPMGTQSGLGAMMGGTRAPNFVKGINQKESIFKKALDFAKAPFKELGKLEKGQAMLTVGAIGTGVSYVIDKLVGPKDPGETMEQYMTRRKSTVSEYLRYYYKNVNPLASEQEVQNFVDLNTEEYENKAQGGRIGYAEAGDVLPEAPMSKEEMAERGATKVYDEHGLMTISELRKFRERQRQKRLLELLKKSKRRTRRRKDWV